MGILKNFKLTERFTAQFRVDAFNLFNHPQFQNGSFNTGINWEPALPWGRRRACSPAVLRATVAIRLPVDILILGRRWERSPFAMSSVLERREIVPKVSPCRQSEL